MPNKRVLVIDDEADIREVIQTCLELMEGWDVLLAGSGEEGLMSAQSKQPDAVLLDVMMPEMDGVATFKQLQANRETRQIPVLLLTAKVQPTDRQRFAALGVVGVITKPFDPLTLTAQIKALLQW
ncbi:MAG: response regulator [Gemmatimonadaceae bacterium]|nr:response regulator [Gloeobacterales cyanobacterium ES-bin-141]